MISLAVISVASMGWAGNRACAGDSVIQKRTAADSREDWHRFIFPLLLRKYLGTV
jgi:hypothetical protein